MKNIISIKLYLLVIFLFSYGKIFTQSYFIENKGQYPSQVIAKKKIDGGAMFIEKGKFTFSFYDQLQLANHHNKKFTSNKINCHSYTVTFKNKTKNIISFFSDKSKYKENYYLGSKKSWAEDVGTYKEINQENIYKGINLKLYMNKGSLKYDLYISKGANYKRIKIKYQGHKKIYIRNDHLIVTTSINTITELKPFSYQIINGKKTEVPCNFVLKNNTVGFDFPNGFDSEFDLVIDPTLVFSTYSGSISDNFGYTATYDNKGFLYSGSTAFGTEYPVTIGAYQTSFSGGITDIAITKYDTSGTFRIFSTYLGGRFDELPHSMVVNSNDELFILGTTGSDNFPVTESAFDTVFSGGPIFSPSGLGISFPNGSDIFVSKLSNNGGSLLSSTFLGGSSNDGLNISTALKFNYADEIRGEIDIDNNNNVYIVSSTSSIDFPTTLNAFQPTLNGDQDGCVIKIDNQLSSIIWSSFLGGEKDDAVYSLALDKNDDIYVTGGTISDNFPTTPLAYDETYNDSLMPDAFVTKISKEGSSILHSSYYGSISYDQSYFIEISEGNQVYLFGQTNSDSTYLVVNSSYFNEGGGQFIAVFNSDLSNIIRSSVIGTGKGSPDISPTAFLVDRCNNIYISGWGSNLGGQLSTLNLPVTDSAFQSSTDGNDFYLAIINEFIDSLVYATYFGGSQSNEHVDGGTSRFDKNGIIYQSVCAGCGNNNDFPVFPNPGAVSTSNNSSNCNNAVFKFDFRRPMVTADFSVPLLSCTTSISFTNTSSYLNNNISYLWDFGDGNITNQINPIHQYFNPGIYQVSLISTSLQSCNISDTITKTIYILSGSRDTLSPLFKCDFSYLQIGIPALNDSLVSYNWMPIDFLNSELISNPYTSTADNIVYELVISNGTCNDTLVQEVIVNDIFVEAPIDTSYCSSPILLSANISSNVNEIIWSSNNLFTDTLSFQADLLSLSPQTYYIKVSDSICFAVDSVDVLSDMIDIDLLSDTLICQGDTVKIEVINITSQNPIVNYIWTPQDVNFITPDSSVIQETPQSTLYYKVEVLNNVGCSISDSINIHVIPKPIIDSLWSENNIVISGNLIKLNIITTHSFLWFNGETSLMINFMPDSTSWYFVDVFNGSCSIRDSLYVILKDLFCNEDSIIIPTGFTPNDDDINDSYRVINKGVDLSYFNLKIYNRLGQSVFTSNNINTHWDGMYKGEKLHSQVLDYYIEMECVGGKKLFKKGNITLIE